MNNGIFACIACFYVVLFSAVIIGLYELSKFLIHHIPYRVDMSNDEVSDEVLEELKKEIAFWGNNCGGCETCAGVFGNKTQPDFDLRELYLIVCELTERRGIK